ncbi:MAG: hypothetical protein ACE363_08190 [Alphaproteobacteria bacterium]
MRGFAVLFVGLCFVPFQVLANQWECFGPERNWCAHTVFDSRPEAGWGVQNKARLPGLVVEIIVDAPANQPRLGVRISPVPFNETARVILSLRADERDSRRWVPLRVVQSQHEGASVYSMLDRRALVTLLEGTEDLVLYAFVEVAGRNGTHKVSHKVTLEGLREALRYARVGR